MHMACSTAIQTNARTRKGRETQKEKLKNKCGECLLNKSYQLAPSFTDERYQLLRLLKVFRGLLVVSAVAPQAYTLYCTY